MNAVSPVLAGVASLAPLWTGAGADPDAGLLALRAELLAAGAAVARLSYDYAASDDDVTGSTARLNVICRAIASSAPARTNAGRALKAAAAMHQLRFCFDEADGKWGAGVQEPAWRVLSEFAGDAYVPTTPEQFEPPRPVSLADSTAHACDPDAELLGLCQQFVSIESAHYAEFIGFAGAGDDRRGDATMRRMAEAHEPLVNRMTDLPPRTLAGAAALARAIEQWSHGDFARHEDTDCRLARTLLKGLVAAGQEQPTTLGERP